MFTIDQYSYAELNSLVKGDKTLTIGELKVLTKELLLYVIHKRERSVRDGRHESWVLEDDNDSVDLEETELSNDEINDLEVTL